MLSGKIGNMLFAHQQLLDQNNKIQTNLLCNFPTNCYIICYNTNCNRWLKAIIIQSRLSKKYTQSKINSVRDQSNFQYYVHYQGYNRRHDEWVEYQLIQKTYQQIKNSRQKDMHIERNSQQYFYSEYYGIDFAHIEVHEKLTSIKNIPKIQIGQYRADTWYFSPYPVYVYNCQCLYLCQFCLSFFCIKNQLRRHSTDCKLFHPPGNEIYRDESVKDKRIAMFQVDGCKNSTYCQNLCLLSKLYLDHKTLELDTSIFLFYILCEIDQNNQYQIVGYFSKVKPNQQQEYKNGGLYYNLSCFLVLPFHQRKGYGKTLISLSYQLSLIENKIGTPERPLSDLGRQTYLSWWAQAIIQYIIKNIKLQNQRMQQQVSQAPQELNLSIMRISLATGILQLDIEWTLKKIGLLKTLKGRLNQKQFYFNLDEEKMVNIYKGFGLKRTIFRQNIHWIPY